jgi:hypothetical protein
MTDECVPAVMKQARGWKSVGDPCFGRGGMRQAREELTKREGPPPFPGAVCRHLCKNDSMAPNGFVCTLHTTWGTQKENVMDQSPEARGRLREAGRIVTARPDHQCRVDVVCPHCGKTGQKWAMMRWHFDRCKHRAPIGFSGLPSVAFGDETNSGYWVDAVNHF